MEGGVYEDSVFTVGSNHRCAVQRGFKSTIKSGKVAPVQSDKSQFLVRTRSHFAATETPAERLRPRRRYRWPPYLATPSSVFQGDQFPVSDVASVNMRSAWR